MEQLSFSDLETSLRRKTRKTRTERLTERLEKLVPWSDLLALIQPFYYESGRRGRQPFPLELMLRIHLLQIAYNMSDPQMEDFLHENSTARKLMSSVATCIFMPKCHVFPFLPLDISGSRL